MSTQQQIDSASDIYNLRDLLNAAPTNGDIDTSALPTFGGTPVDAPDVYSWDAEHVLVCDTASGGEYVVIDRTHGTVRATDGNPVFLEQQAFIVDTETYRAHGVDARGNEYRVEWDIVDVDSEDEGNACDWDNPRSVMRIGAGDAYAHWYPTRTRVPS